MTVAVFVGALEVTAINSSTGRPLSPRRLAQVDEFKKPYRILLDLVQRDQGVNRKYADGFAQKAKKLKAKRKRGDKAHERRIADFESLSKSYMKLYLLNTTILDGFDRGTTETAKLCMDQIVLIESQIQAITGREVERAWLTFDEFNTFHDKGYVARKAAGGARPFAKKLWMVVPESAEKQDIVAPAKKTVRKRQK